MDCSQDFSLAPLDVPKDQCNVSFEDLVLQNLDKPWNWYCLGTNPNITLDFIDKHPDLPWIWSYCLSQQDRITPQFVEKHIDKDWDWKEFVDHPNFTIEFVVKHLKEPYDERDWNVLSSNRKLTLEFVLKHPDKPWNWINIAKNPNIPLADILQCPNPPSYTGDWDWAALSNSPKISLEFILNNPDKEWNYYNIAKNPNISIDYIDKNPIPPWGHPDKGWDIETLCYWNKVTPEFLLKNLRLYDGSGPKTVDRKPNKWNWTYLTLIDNITLDFIDQLPDLSSEPGPNGTWNWDQLSRSSKITTSFVDKHADKPWNWRALLAVSHHNSKITIDLVAKHLDKPWDWRSVSYSPMMTVEFLDKYPTGPPSRNLDQRSNETWDWFLLSINKAMKIEEILKYPNLWRYWVWDEVYSCRSESITIDLIEKYPVLDRSYKAHSYNRNITIEYIEQHPTDRLNFVVRSDQFANLAELVKQARAQVHKGHWDYDHLSRNPIITMDYVLKNNDKAWNWGRYGLSSNTSILPCDVANNPNPPHGTQWNWEELSTNNFTRYNQLMAEKIKKEHRYIFRDCLSEIEASPIRPKLPGKVWWIPSLYQEAKQHFEELYANN